MLDVMIGAPTTTVASCAHIIFGVSGFLHDKKTEVRASAFALLGRILDAYIAARNGLDAPLCRRTPISGKRRIGSCTAMLSRVLMKSRPGFT